MSAAAVAFFSKYEAWILPEPNSGCWLWLGSTTSGGYGNLTKGNKSLYAHRCAYEATRGNDSASGLVVRHRCDTPCCVNPDHLLGGTHADNARDKVARGRGNPTRGESHPRAVLTDHTVLAMRAAAEAGDYVAEIARVFGASYSLARGAIHGATWTHLGGVPENVQTWTPPHPGYGEESPRALLTAAQVLEIRDRLSRGAVGRRLAKEYGVSAPTISAINTRRIWPHI